MESLISVVELIFISAEKAKADAKAAAEEARRKEAEAKKFGKFG